MQFNKLLFSIIFLIGIYSTAQGQKNKPMITQSFYIKHRATNKIVTPYLGAYKKGTQLCVAGQLNNPNNKAAKFYLEYAPNEGSMGYLVPESAPHLYVVPAGLKEWAAEGILLLWEKENLPGALFSIDQGKNLITHTGGENWNLVSGAQLPADNTGLVNWNADYANSKFVIIDEYGNPMKLPIPVRVSSNWKLVYSFENLQNDTLKDQMYRGSISETKSISRSNEKETHSSFSFELATESEIYGNGISTSSKISYDVKNKYSATKNYQNSIGSEVEIKYELSPGEGIYIWQEILNAEHYEDKRTFSSMYFKLTNDKNCTPGTKAFMNLETKK